MTIATEITDIGHTHTDDFAIQLDECVCGRTPGPILECGEEVVTKCCGATLQAEYEVRVYRIDEES